MMASIDGFDDLQDEIEEIANAYDNIQSRDGTELSAHGAIEQGVENAMDEAVMPDAKSGAEPHVGADRAQTIEHERGEWAGDRYQHYFGATSDIVAYHEFGTGPKAVDQSESSFRERGTTHDGRSGYVITSDTGPVKIGQSDWESGPTIVFDRFGWQADDGDGGEGADAFFNYVVHPGVEPQHFMRDAIEDNAPEMRGYILASMQEMFRKAGVIN